MANMPAELPNIFSNPELIPYPDFDFSAFVSESSEHKKLSSEQVSILNNYLSEFSYATVNDNFSYYFNSFATALSIYDAQDKSIFGISGDGHAGTWFNFAKNNNWVDLKYWPARNGEGEVEFIIVTLDNFKYYSKCDRNNWLWTKKVATERNIASTHYLRSYSPAEKYEFPKDEPIEYTFPYFPDKFASIKYINFPPINLGLFNEHFHFNKKYPITAEQAEYLKKYFLPFADLNITTEWEYIFDYFDKGYEIRLYPPNANYDHIGIGSMANRTYSSVNIFLEDNIAPPYINFKKVIYGNYTPSGKECALYDGGDAFKIYQNEYDYAEEQSYYNYEKDISSGGVAFVYYVTAFEGAPPQPVEKGKLTFTLNLTGMGNDPCKRCCSCEIEEKKYKTIIEFTSDEALEDKVTIDPADLEFEWQGNTLNIMLAEGETVTVDQIPAGVEYEILVESDDPCDENEYIVDNGEGSASGIIGQDSEGNPQEETEVTINAQRGETVEEYLERLRQRGYEALAESLKLENVEFTLQDERIKLGDLVTVDMPEFDFKAVVRVTGVKLKSQGNQTIRTISVGTPLKILRRSKI